MTCYNFLQILLLKSILLLKYFFKAINFSTYQHFKNTQYHDSLAKNFFIFIYYIRVFLVCVILQNENDA